MAHKPQSLYQILHVPVDAKSTDIERAYRRIKAEMQKETTPPDARLRVMVEQAHDVLMDPARRAAYDKEWFAPKAQIVRAKRSPAAIAAIAAAVVAVGVAGWFATRAPSAPVRTSVPKEKVQEAAALAVGRVQQIQMSGENVPLGLAFAIAEGTLVSSCEGMSPNAEMSVRFGKRSAPVRVTQVDEATGLCRLSAGTVGSWPLELARAEPQSGETVYYVGMGPSAEPQLAENHFRRALKAGDVRAFEAEVPPNIRDLGGPLIDLDGRVLGAASKVGTSVVWVPVPRAWLPEVREVQKAKPEPREAPPEAKDAPDRPPGPEISPERRQRLEKAFRPPPNVPDDI